MNVIFLCGVLLSVIIVCWASTSPNLINGENEAIGQILRQTARQHRERYHRLHGRSKRFDQHEELMRDEGELWFLKGFETFRGCPGVLRQFQVFEIDGLLFSVIITNEEENNVHIHRFSLEHGCQDLLETLPTRAALDFQLNKVNHGVRLIVIEKFSPMTLKHSGSQVFTLTISNSKVEAKRAEVLKSENPACITSWIQGGVPHLAICNGVVENSGVMTYSDESNIFCASGGYYDLCDVIDTHNPKKIHYFNILSTHFLAVANHPNETEGEDVPLGIWRYDLSKETYLHYQYLAAKGAVDVCSLTLGSGFHEEHYIVVVNQYSFDKNGGKDFNTNSYIYKFVDSKFEPFQSIPTHKATSCLSYKAGKDKLVLMVADATGAVSYQYDGWRFVPATVYTQHAMGPGLQHLQSSIIGDQLYIAASNGNAELDESSNLFLPMFELQLTLSDVYDKTTTWCNDYRMKMNRDTINRMADFYPHAVRKNDTEVTLGSVDFGKLAADKVVADELTIEAEKIRVGLPVVRELQDVHIRIAGLIDKLRDLDAKQQNAIRSEGDYVINGPVTVDDLSSTCTDECRVPEINAVNINEEDMNKFFDQTVYLSDEHVPSILYFSNLVVNGAVDAPVLSDKKTDEYVQTDQDLTFTNKFHVDGNISFTKSLDVDGSVNGKKISSSDLLLRDGDQSLDWNLEVDNIEVPRMQVSTINDRNVSFYYSKSFTPRSNFKLVQPTFASIRVEELTLTGHINGIDVSQLFQNGMKTSGNQSITGSHKYTSVGMGSVTVGGSVNGQNFPDNRLISVSDKETVVNLATLHLKGDSNVFSTLNVTNEFAGLHVKDGRLDSGLLLKNRSLPQVITGNKTIASLRSRGNVISQTVNNKTVPLFNTNSSIHGDPNSVLTYNDLKIYGHAVFDHPLNVSNLTNIDLDRVKEKGVQLNTTTFPPFDSITFEGDVIVGGDLSARSVNSVPKGHFLTKNISEPVVVTGRKSFVNVSLNKPLQMNSLLNGHNLTDVWESSLHLDGNQTMGGTLVINNDTNATTLVAGKTPFVSLKNIGKVNGTKRFGSVKIEGNLTADSVETDGPIDGVDLRSWPRDTLFKNGDNQAVTGRKFFAKLNVSNATVDSAENFDVGIFADIIMSNGPAVINGNLVLNGSFQSTDSFVDGSLDGKESNLPLYLLRNGVDQSFSGGLTVKGPLRVDAFHDKSWTINGIDVRQLLDETVKTDQPLNLSVAFGTIVVDNINVGGLIQTLKFPDDLVFRNSSKPQVVHGEKRFVGSVRSDSLEVANLINGENPSKLCQAEPFQQSRKWIVHGDVVVEESAEIDIGKINELNLDKLPEGMWLKDTDVVLTHDQVLDDVEISGTFDADGVVNGLNLNELKQKVVNLSGVEQTVKGVHSFDTLAASRLVADNFKGSSINEIDRNALKVSVLLDTEEQLIANNITFQNVVAKNVDVVGSVNGLDLGNDMMKKDKANVVSGHKILDKIVVGGDVAMCNNCTIGGVDVSQWAANAVLRTGNFTVSAPVIFDQVKFELPLTVEGTLDGVLFDRDHLMTLNDDQEIEGDLTFSAKPPDSIFRDSDSDLRDAHHNSTEGFKLSARIKTLTVDGNYAGVNLTHFFDHAVHQNKEVTFTGPVSLAGLEATVVGDNSTNSTIRDILQGPTATEFHLADLLNVQPVKQSEIDKLLENISRIVPNLATELQHFKEVENDLPLEIVADKIYVIRESAHGNRPTVCYYNNKQFRLYCGSSGEPLLYNKVVTSVAASKDGNFAVAFTAPSSPETSAGFKIYSYLDATYPVIQESVLSNASMCTAVTIKNRTSCFLIADTSSVSVYCRPMNSTENYEKIQTLALPDVRQMAVCYQNDGSPIVTVRSGSQQSRVIILHPEGDDGRFQHAKTIVTLRIVSIDCACDLNQCFVATLSPSKPAAIPGDVIIWSLNNIEQPVRRQRISISEPTDVKFALLPDGRLALVILQPSGIHNVLVFIWEGQSMFNYKTTVNVPGVQDMDIVSSAKRRQLLLLLTVKTPLSDLAPNYSVRLFEGHFIGLSDTSRDVQDD